MRQKLNPALAQALGLPDNLEVSVSNHEQFATEFQYGHAMMTAIGALLQSKLTPESLVYFGISYSNVHQNATDAAKKRAKGYKKEALEHLRNLKRITDAEPNINTVFMPLRTGDRAGHWQLLQLDRHGSDWKVTLFQSINVLAHNSKQQIIEQDYRRLIATVSEVMGNIIATDYQQILLQQSNPDCAILTLCSMLVQANALRIQDITDAPFGAEGTRPTAAEEAALKATFLAALQYDPEHSKQVLADYFKRINSDFDSENVFTAITYALFDIKFNVHQAQNAQKEKSKDTPATSTTASLTSESTSENNQTAATQPAVASHHSTTTNRTTATQLNPPVAQESSDINQPKKKSLPLVAKVFLGILIALTFPISLPIFGIVMLVRHKQKSKQNAAPRMQAKAPGLPDKTQFAERAKTTSVPEHVPTAESVVVPTPSFQQ